MDKWIPSTFLWAANRGIAKCIVYSHSQAILSTPELPKQMTLFTERRQNGLRSTLPKNRTLLSERHHSSTRSPSSGLGSHTLEALLPGPCIRPTHAISPRSRRDGLPVSAGRRSRASGTLVTKLELGNEGLKLVAFTEKCQK